MTGEKTNVVTLELTEIDAETFREYRCYQDNFETLLKAGVFEMKNTTVEIDLDGGGVITNIKRHDLLFNRRDLST